MKTPACSRTWEAEAVGDGRLDPTARSSFERHAATCDACSEQLRMLARVSKAMRELPQYRSQAIDRRRQRIALIQRANEQLMRGSSRRLGISVFAAVGVCALVLALVGTRWETRRGWTVAPVHTPSFEVVEVGNATWTTSAVRRTVRVALSVGTAAIHVEHLTYDQRFFVELPDGELEVRGTRFQLNVADHRTTRVEVSEGVVVLRLVGRPEIVLTAGQQWTMPTPVAATSGVARSVEPPPANPPPAMPPRSSGPIARAPVHHPLEDTPPSSSPTADAPVSSEVVPVVDGYEACIRAFESGNYAGADRLLAAFQREHPSDARGEDAAFLRAVSHARMGDAVGAAQLASEYLQRYPRGLRTWEARRLAASGEAPRP
jgi:TolA-binding protein